MKESARLRAAPLRAPAFRRAGDGPARGWTRAASGRLTGTNTRCRGERGRRTERSRPEKRRTHRSTRYTVLDQCAVRGDVTPDRHATF